MLNVALELSTAPDVCTPMRLLSGPFEFSSIIILIKEVCTYAIFPSGPT